MPALLRHARRALLAGAKAIGDLGRHFGGTLYEREARFLRDQEWAETADDILDRRTKHGLHLTPAERDAFEVWLQSLPTNAGTEARSA